MNTTTIASSAAQILLGATFTKAGTDKLRGTDAMRADFDRFDYSPGFMRLVGTVEATAGTALLLGLVSPRAARFGSALLIPTMAGALYTHLVRAGDGPKDAAPAAVMLSLATGVLAAR